MSTLERPGPKEFPKKVVVAITGQTHRLVSGTKTVATLNSGVLAYVHVT